MKKDKIFITLIFILSTLYLVFQHYSVLSWDFSAYLLNAQYWFANGTYFEILRPPLMPFLLGIFGKLTTWLMAEYIFIIFVSALFCFSTIHISKSLKFNSALFYALSVTPYMLFNSTLVGAELLSLTFLVLAVSFVIRKNPYAGIFLALAGLSRTTYFVFLPILFLNFDIKKIIKSILLFSLTILPWFLYNYFIYGNFFTSIADQYANNILFRYYINLPYELIHFLQTQGLLLPFSIFGIILTLYILYKNFKPNLFWIKKYRIEFIMLFLFFHTLYFYKDIPLKYPRFLFTIILPTAYFSYQAIIFLLKKKKNFIPYITIFLIIFTLIFSFIYIMPEKTDNSLYLDANQKLVELGISDCSIRSNTWIFLSYYGQESTFYQGRIIGIDIENQHFILLFKNDPEVAFLNNETEKNKYPIFYEDEKIIIYGEDNCKPFTPVNKPFYEYTNQMILEMGYDEINTNPCFLLFGKYPFLEKSCNFVNLQGFKIDSNRGIA